MKSRGSGSGRQYPVQLLALAVFSAPVGAAGLAVVLGMSEPIRTQGYVALCAAAFASGMLLGKRALTNRRAGPDSGEHRQRRGLGIWWLIAIVWSTIGVVLVWPGP